MVTQPLRASARAIPRRRRILAPAVGVLALGLTFGPGALAANAADGDPIPVVPVLLAETPVWPNVDLFCSSPTTVQDTSVGTGTFTSSVAADGSSATYTFTPADGYAFDLLSNLHGGTWLNLQSAYWEISRAASCPTPPVVVNPPVVVDPPVVVPPVVVPPVVEPPVVVPPVVVPPVVVPPVVTPPVVVPPVVVPPVVTPPVVTPPVTTPPVVTPPVVKPPVVVPPTTQNPPATSPPVVVPPTQTTPPVASPATPRPASTGVTPSANPAMALTPRSTPTPTWSPLSPIPTSSVDVIAGDADLFDVQPASDAAASTTGVQLPTQAVGEPSALTPVPMPEVTANAIVSSNVTPDNPAWKLWPLAVLGLVTAGTLSGVLSIYTRRRGY